MIPNVYSAMRYKIHPREVFWHPEDAKLWAKAHGLATQRFKAIDLFTFNPVCDVHIYNGKGVVQINYDVRDTSKESATWLSVFFSVVVEYDTTNPLADKFAFN